MSEDRQTVTSTQGMVVCPHFQASEVGAQILRAGGNAVDAAIAIQAALSVVYPHMTGLGGDAFWLIYDTNTQSLHGLNGSGRAAKTASIDFFQNQGLSTIPQRGPLSAITVPGAVDSWSQAHQRFGQMSWDTILQPAIALAIDGYEVTRSQAYWTRRDLDYFEQHSPCPCPFLPDGRLPQSHEHVTNPDLAHSLTLLASQGAAAFYQGEMAARISKYLGTVGGLLTQQDFALHRSNWVQPIETDYRGFRVMQLPPNSQGFTVLQMLNLLEPFNLEEIGHGTADYYHLLIETIKRSFQDRDYWLSDPEFVDIPIFELISKAYCDRRRSQISMSQATPFPTAPIGGDTAYTAVVDAVGNAVSIIQSVYYDFGSAVVVPGTGFVLQNRGCFFSLNPNHNNCLFPSKRPFHTLMPGMVLHSNGHPHLVLGTMGGEGQPQTQLALLTRLLDFEFDIQSAINAPRWRWGRTWGSSIAELSLENRISIDVRQALEKRGHPLTIEPDWSTAMGHAHVIRCSTHLPRLEGGCDPRSDGIAIGV